MRLVNPEDTKPRRRIGDLPPQIRLELFLGLAGGGAPVKRPVGLFVGLAHPVRCSIRGDRRDSAYAKHPGKHDQDQPACPHVRLYAAPFRLPVGGIRDASVQFRIDLSGAARLGLVVSGVEAAAVHAGQPSVNRACTPTESLGYCPPSLAFPPPQAGKQYQHGLCMPAAFLLGLEDFPNVIGRRAIHELPAWHRFAFLSGHNGFYSLQDPPAMASPRPGGRFRSTAAVPGRRCRRANPVISLPIFAGSLHLTSQVDHNPPTGEFFLRRPGAKRQTPVGASQSPESAFQILMTGTIRRVSSAG